MSVLIIQEDKCTDDVIHSTLNTALYILMPTVSLVSSSYFFSTCAQLTSFTGIALRRIRHVLLNEMILVFDNAAVVCKRYADE